MNFNFENKNKYSFTISILTVTLFVFGILSIFMGQAGIALVPILSGVLSVVFLAEKGRKRIFSFVIPLVLLVAEFAITKFFTFNILASLGVAIFIYFAFTYRKISKAEFSGYATVFLTVIIGTIFMVTAFRETGSFSFKEALLYYENLFENLKNQFVEKILSTNNALEVTREVAEELFAVMTSTFPALTVVFAFLLVGLSFKVFSLISFKFLEDKAIVFTWRFKTSSVFAYFYIVLVILNIFTSASVGVFEISVNNLYTIFTFVYAYIGFGMAVVLIGQRMNKVFAFFLVLFGLLMFNSFAMQLLAILAVFFTIMSNKVINNFNNNTPRGV